MTNLGTCRAGVRSSLRAGRSEGCTVKRFPAPAWAPGSLPSRTGPRTGAPPRRDNPTPRRVGASRVGLPLDSPRRGPTGRKNTAQGRGRQVDAMGNGPASAVRPARAPEPVNRSAGTAARALTRSPVQMGMSRPNHFAANHFAISSPIEGQHLVEAFGSWRTRTHSECPPSCAVSGRGRVFSSPTQGLGLAASALGWVLPALRAGYAKIHTQISTLDRRVRFNAR